MSSSHRPARLATIASSLLLFVVSCIVLAHSSEAAPEYKRERVSTPADIAAIRKVVDDFKTAITGKNGKQLSSLVLHSRILFTSPGDQAQVDSERAFDSNFDGVGVSGFGQFAKFITTAKEAIEEKFYNVEITQDGPVAWVMFDYEFYVDGKMTNYGVEHWQLRKTDGKWKIFSVVWTRHVPGKS
jgi:ketosteroid isomerase-like protein